MQEEPKCWTRLCRHFIGPREVGEGDGTSVGGIVNVCKAYPKGIPDEIAYGSNLHLRAFPGDRGIRYKKWPGAK